MGKLGWAYIAVEGFEHALMAFQGMEKVILIHKYGETAT